MDELCRYVAPLFEVRPGESFMQFPEAREALQRVVRRMTESDRRLLERAALLYHSLKPAKLEWEEQNILDQLVDLVLAELGQPAF